MPVFDLHYRESDAAGMLGVLAPEALQKLHLGVACAGFQCEGGYNQPGQPLNNWADWEGQRGVAVSGGACGFWERFREDAQRVAAAGLDTFRLSIEWPRITPCRERGSPASELAIDPAAVEHYAQILGALRAERLDPLVTLYHWTHPLSLGLDLWLDPESPQVFARYVRQMLGALLPLLERDGTAPPTRYITFNEPNMYALVTYIARRFPGGPTKAGGHAARTCLENQLLAHLAAAKVVRELYAERGLPKPLLSFNNNFSAFYRADAFFVDLVHAPRLQVKRGQLEAFIRSREERFTREFLASEGEIPVLRQMARLGFRALEGVLRQGARLERLPRLVDAVYRLEEPAVDYLCFDYYDPFPWNLLGGATPGSDRGPGPVVDEWEWKPHPRGLSVALELYSQAAPDLPLWIGENGMATRGLGGQGMPRPDGARRDLFIKAHLMEWLRARARGVPVEGYLHWSLWDNYEWGSYQPRFGLLGLDAAGGALERTGLDAVGVASLEAYAQIARAVRAGDGKALAHALADRTLPALAGSRASASLRP